MDGTSFFLEYTGVCNNLSLRKRIFLSDAVICCILYL